MTKYIERLLLLLLPAMAFTACTEDEGTEPGNDGGPSLVVYDKDTEAPNDADIDATYRVSTNNKTQHLYYLAEPTSSVESNLSDDAYAQKVISEGTEVTLQNDSVTGGYTNDVVVKNLKGDYTITFAAVSGNSTVIKKKTFTGLIWNTIKSGTYYTARVAYRNFGLEQTVTTALQQLESDPTQYRIQNLYGIGNSLILTSTGVKGSDANGDYTYVTIGGQATSGSYGSYGTTYLVDVPYLYGDAYATDASYGCKMYDSGNVVLVVMYCIVWNGSLANGALLQNFTSESFVAN